MITNILISIITVLILQLPMALLTISFVRNSERIYRAGVITYEIVVAVVAIYVGYYL